MSKFLIILPVSIAGTLIMKGLSNGLKSCGYLTIEKDIREISPEDLKSLGITTIIGYDYGYLHNDKLAEYITNNCDKYKLVNCFADNPHSSFANEVDGTLYERLKKINPFVFMWDSTYLNDFEKSYYLPLAVDLALYDSEISQPTYPITFVGRPLGEKRQKILSLISKVYGRNLKIFSFEKHFNNGADQMLEKGLLNQKEYETFKESFCGFIKTEKELSHIYSHSKINLNITIQGENNLNYRIFEVLGSCGFLLTDYQKDLEKFFDLSKDLETYKDKFELIDKIDFYLKNAEIAQKIAINGYAKICEKHTFIDRARTILSIVEHL